MCKMTNTKALITCVCLMMGACLVEARHLNQFGYNEAYFGEDEKDAISGKTTIDLSKDKNCPDKCASVCLDLCAFNVCDTVEAAKAAKSPANLCPAFCVNVCPPLCPSICKMNTTATSKPSTTTTPNKPVAGSNTTSTNTTSVVPVLPGLTSTDSEPVKLRRNPISNGVNVRELSYFVMSVVPLMMLLI